MKLKLVLLLSLLTCLISSAQTYSVVKIEILCEIDSVLPNFNSSANEFSPFVLNNAIYFSSDRDPDIAIGGENNWSNKGHLNLYESEYKGDLNGNTKFKAAHLLSERFVFDSHTGPACFSTTGDTIFISQVLVDGKEGTFRPQLYYAVKYNNRYTKLKALPFNNERYTFSHPFYDSRSNRLYFSSDKEGGKGGFDLYYSELSDFGWSNPEPLSGANTIENEAFPFVMDNMLFFASDRKSKKDGLDYYWKILDNSAEVNSIDGLNSTKDDFGIYIFPGMKKGFVSTNRNGNDDILFFKMERKITVRNEMAGEFVFTSLKGYPSGITVQILDDNDFVLYETETDEFGKFVFQDINYDQNYRIKAISEADLELNLADQNGKGVASLLGDDDNLFYYRKVDPSKAGTLSLIPEDMIDLSLNQGHLTAQLIYDDRVNEYPAGKRIILVDENGKEAFSTLTDKNGNFDFQKIPMSQNYILKINEETEDMILLIYDLKGNVVAELKPSETGDFTYRKLNPDIRNQLTLMDEGDDSFDYNSQTIWGYFEYENKTLLSKSNLVVKAYNEKGELVSSQLTDEKGMFRFRDLPVDRSLLFTLEENGENFILDDFTLYVFDRNGQKIAGLRRGQDGFFTFRPLGYDNSNQLSKIEEEHLDFILGEYKNRQRILVYFDSNQSQVKSNDLVILANLFSVLKSNPNVRVEINAYADAKSSDEYNLILSKKRGEWVYDYLVKKGIKADRIIVNAYGESRLIDKTNDALNRRAEIHLY